MKPSLPHEYHALVKDVLLFFGASPSTPKAPLPPKIIPVKKPKPAPAPKVAPPKIKKSIEIKPLVAAPPKPLSAMHKLIKKIAPNLPLHDTIPSDQKARRIKDGWKERKEIPPVPILCIDPKTKPFLENVAKAVSLSFAPCRVIDAAHFEKNESWDLFLETQSLKYIIAPDSLIWNSKLLLSHYKDEDVRLLGKVPLLLLPDLTLYMKDPFLKRSLWNVLCQSLQSL